MAALAWLVAPALAVRFAGTGTVPLVKALIVCLTVGLVWQFALVAILVGREQGTLRWSTVRDSLWLGPPRNPRSGRVGRRLWWIAIALVVVVAAVADLIPTLAVPEGRDLGALVRSEAGKAFLHGAWGWYALLLTMFLFNTVLGEELLFRGYLLPRMNRVFGRGDWIVNGILFTGYHLHVPWVMPGTLVESFLLAYPTKRYRSAWMGIVAHSAQSVFFAILVLTLVL